MNPFKIAFVGIGQNYPSHVWMGRMKQMLGDHVVLNVDDLRNTPRGSNLSDDTHYIPRKVSRAKRAMRSIGLVRQTDDAMRSQWLLNQIRESKASSVFVHFLDFATKFNDVWNRLDIPIVVHCHGYDITWDVRHHVHQTPLHPVDYPSSVRSLPDNVWFIANSNYTRNQLLKLDINPRKIFLKRFGVPLSNRPRVSTASDRPQVLFLGRLVDFKGPLETVEAFGQIAGNHPGSRLEIAGSGGLSTDLNDLIRDRNLQSAVHCHGAVDQATGAAMRQRSAIFTAHNQTGAVTRQCEAFGVSLLEAMGEGVPVVTGRSGGIVDFIQSDQNGMLFEPGDIDSHAGMLDDLMSSAKRRESLGAAAWETVRDGYQSHHEKSDLLRIFREVSDTVAAPTIAAPTIVDRPLADVVKRAA
ncbi:GDP-mannose-dependent alpha-(1-6)-phosphatidylinositol monomannoside mannosyltransferase [Rubripirellula lacrimiformis]|uniref:GDP-mannose-dependent alpha-(1-6)-phosphatidylinositol monomannoside mannosyltransferase n=1 Tax=Rubripirellula lacrimiformis TaxID=1930273 RepID=A0A517NLA4_9BACT|nr:glycosyltransferase family 4 protein [Rubripirellula lacrimiformis]QDT07917.1 GDP-mannose-dependent alpha-(1-6)-phosphatidylinositol monomannoside mannosyltransferase [Rubripirellula lacrimiformis]